MQKKDTEPPDIGAEQDYNYYESCKDRYGRMFSPELKRLFREHDKPIPFILEILDTVCTNRSCSHNIFWKGITWGDTSQNLHPEPTQQPWTLRCRNCMCLLELDDGASFADIGKTFGIKRQSVYKFSEKGISKLRELIGGDAVHGNPVNN